MSPQFDAIGFIASDLPATLAFYRDLGLEFPPDAESQPHVEVVVGGIRLMFDPLETVQSFSDYTPPGPGHRVALAFLCDTPAEVDETYARIVGLGHRGVTEPFDAPWGQRYATVMDPDGNPVDLFAGAA